LLGDPDSHVEPSGIPGLVFVKTFLDPFQVVEGLRGILCRSPEELHYVLKVVPVEEVIDSDLEAFSALGRRLESKIRSEETFRIIVQKRYSRLDRDEIIHTIAENIDRKVDLVSPAKVVWIEILGGITGVSILNPNSIFSLECAQRDLKE